MTLLEVSSKEATTDPPVGTEVSGVPGE